MKPQRPAFLSYGGKWTLAKWILTFFPPHITYVEPYCGAASLLFRKTRSQIEVINDLNGDIVNFFRVLRDNGPEFIERIFLIPHARSEFEWAVAYTGVDPIERARAFYVLSWQGFAGKKTKSSYWWSRGVTKREQYRWSETLLLSLQQCVVRMRNVIIEAIPAEIIIKQRDNSRTLYYLDPPYLPETRGSKGDYKGYEMSPKQHEALLLQLSEIKGMALLSGYPSELYDNLLTGWERFDYYTISSQALAHGPRKDRERTECIWMNPWAYKVWTADRIRKGETEWKQT